MMSEEKGESVNQGATGKNKNDFDLLFKGAFEYYHKKDLFSDENFQLYRHRKDSTLLFESEVLARLDSGEFMKMYLLYKVNKDFVPTVVVSDKYIGNQHVQEKFININNNTAMVYEFTVDDKTHTEQIPVPPRFQIATPHAATKFLHLASKKYDPTGRNFYNILTSNNFWEFKEPPQMRYVLMERVSTTPVEVKIKEKVVKGTYFKVFAQNENEGKNATDLPLHVYISKHYTIPYLIEGLEGVKIQIRYLNEIDKPSFDDP